MTITLLDGPVGTELLARGYSCPAPEWSAWALLHAPDAVRTLHQEYAAAGAQIHTTNTFRTRPEALGSQWAAAARLAVGLAREGAGPGRRVAGSIAPLADCYRPEDSPDNPGPRHAALARVLVDAGVDLLLCETFPHTGEALAAVEVAVAEGIETWVAFSAGPLADLLTPDQVRRGAEAAVRAGAGAVLVNCIPAKQTLRFVSAIADLGVPFGAYANAGHTEDGLGWHPDPDGPQRYAELAQGWVELGATLIGSCCGTGPAHTQALHTRFCGQPA
jgi:S-methylmethionine-dependent homocysteine/selenocysteine methylase